MTKEIIFSYCGGMFPYYLGIASVLQNKYDLSDVVYSATSGGSFAPLLLNSKRDIADSFQKILNFIESNNNSWEKIIYEFLEEELTEEDVLLNNDKINIKLTRVNDFFLPEKVLVKRWDNKQDLAKCISASCFVPLLCGNKFYSEYRGNKIIDGFFASTSTIPVTDHPNIIFRIDKWRMLNPANMIPSNDTSWLKSIFELGKFDAEQHSDEIENLLNPLKENNTQNDTNQVPTGVGWSDATD